MDQSYFSPGLRAVGAGVGYLKSNPRSPSLHASINVLSLYFTSGIFSYVKSCAPNRCKEAAMPNPDTIQTPAYRKAFTEYMRRSTPTELSLKAE